MTQKPAALVVDPRSILIGSAFILGCLAMGPHAVLIPAEPTPERAAVLPELDPEMLGITARDNARNRKNRRREARLARAR